MLQKSKDIFYIDPDYENFVPRKTHLKWKSINSGHSKYSNIGFAVLVHLGVTFFWFMLVCYVSIASVGRYDAEGINTIFNVVGCEIGSEDNAYIQITYRYTVGEIVYTNSTRTNYSQLSCTDFPDGTTVKGAYLETEPEVSRVIQRNFYSSWNNDLWNQFTLLLFMNSVVLPLSAMGFISHFWLARKYHLLRTEGVVLDGELLNVTPEPIKHGRYIAVFQYQYETPDGRLLENRCIAYPSQMPLVRIPKFLTPIKVLYANDRTVVML